MGLDPAKETRGRQIVRYKGQALVAAMALALKGGNAQAAQLVAAECVLDAETKDHQNWELMSHAAKELSGGDRQALSDACLEIEEQADEHFSHSARWCRKLSMDALGLPDVLPPPKEKQNVKSAREAVRARKSMARV
jgi:hypothetical protein